MADAEFGLKLLASVCRVCKKDHLLQAVGPQPAQPWHRQRSK